MVNKNLHLIGKIKEAHGLKGELLLIIFSKDYSPWLKLKRIYLAADDKSQEAEMKVLNIRKTSQGLVVRLENLIDRTPAEKLRGYLAFVPEELAKSKSGERIFLREILNFEVFNRDELIGKITNFSSNGPQDLLLVSHSNFQKPIEIPFVEAFIVKLDFSKKTLRMDLPEGLIEVNEGRGE